MQKKYREQIEKKFLARLTSGRRKYCSEKLPSPTPLKISTLAIQLLNKLITIKRKRADFPSIVEVLGIGKYSILIAFFIQIIIILPLALPLFIKRTIVNI